MLELDPPFYSCLLGFTAGHHNGVRREINTWRLPAAFGQPYDIRTRSATQIQRPPREAILGKLFQHRWSDASVAGWAPVVLQGEE